MSLNAVRIGDFVAKTCPRKKSGPFFTGSSRTFINGRGAVRVNDRSVPGPALTGSSRTFIDGRAAVRLKDRVLCGVITRASNNTFIG